MKSDLCNTIQVPWCLVFTVQVPHDTHIIERFVTLCMHTPVSYDTFLKNKNIMNKDSHAHFAVRILRVIAILNHGYFHAASLDTYDGCTPYRSWALQ